MCTWMDENAVLVAAWLLVTAASLAASGLSLWAIVRITRDTRQFTGDQVDGDWQ